MRILLALAAGLTASAASAEVKSASEHGFVIEQRATLVVPPEVAFRSIGEVRNWWSPDHTYSGNASNLSLELRPGGCFCERLDSGGGIEHLRVAYLEPGKRVVLTGALGPLLYEGVSGVMDFQVERTAGGSVLKMSYKASGFANGGAARLAPVVDKVLGEQMKRLRTFATNSDKKL
ncbi:ATPase [Sphingomonas arenae]|uniref:ATPase n=1 Tax=Sphingomonas arenae TaxID=2812555 RepID=UPI0019677767|nr:ATPase [Sphingomonas arenae]